MKSTLTYFVVISLYVHCFEGHQDYKRTSLIPESMETSQEFDQPSVPCFFSGEFSSPYEWNGHHSFVMGTGVRELTKHVRFDKSFDNKPAVMVALSGFDTAHTKNVRLTCKASNISTQGFTLKVTTWADSVIYSFTCSWMASGI